MVFLNATLVSLDSSSGINQVNTVHVFKSVQAKVFLLCFLFVCLFVLSLFVFAFYSSHSRQSTGRTYRGAFATLKLKANGVHINSYLPREFI